MFDTKEQIQQLKEAIEVEKMRKELFLLRKENSELEASTLSPNKNSLMYKVGNTIGSSMQSEISFENDSQNTNKVPNKVQQAIKEIYARKNANKTPSINLESLIDDEDVNLSKWQFVKNLKNILESSNINVIKDGSRNIYFAECTRQDVINIINNFTKYPFNVKYAPNGYFSTQEICAWINRKPSSSAITSIYPKFEGIHSVLLHRVPYYKIDKDDFLKRRSERKKVKYNKISALSGHDVHSKTLEEYRDKLGDNWHLLKDIQEILGVSMYSTRKFIKWLNLADDLVKYYDGKNAGILKNTKFYHIEKDSMKDLFDKYDQGDFQPPCNKIHGVGFTPWTSDNSDSDIYSHNFVWKLVNGKVLENTYLKEGQLNHLSEIKDEHTFGKSLQFIESKDDGKHQRLIFIKMSALDPSCVKKIQEFVKKS